MKIIFQDKAGNQVEVTAISDMHVMVDALPFSNDSPQAAPEKKAAKFVWYNPGTWMS